MSNIIEPRVLKGFRDFLPEVEIPRQRFIHTLKNHFSSYGYVPIDTPAMEYAEILLSKEGGETGKQVYSFADKGGRTVGLRFDLTVPFARFTAANRNAITMPFRRYHIAKVWRGENTQRGRYREFVQCDFDIIGSDSPAADLEILLMMADGMQALGAGSACIKFSHRGFLGGLLEKLGLGNTSEEVLRIVDKLGKIGPTEVECQLTTISDSRAAGILMEFIRPAADNRSTLEKMHNLAGAGGDSAALRLQALLDAVEQLDMQETFQLDPSIARGLDYYTGIVFETFLEDLPEIGSVCSGGRYDNLTGLFMKEAVSGVGASIGLDRLMAALTELGRLETGMAYADVLILMLEESLLPLYQQLARHLRSLGLSVEVYPEPKKISAQFKYAETRGIPVGIVAGPDEAASGTVNVRELRKRDSFNGLTIEEAGKKTLALLSR